MRKKIISTDSAPKAIGPYSQAVLAGGFVFISGQLPIDPETKEMVERDIKKQTAMVLKNIRNILESLNLDLSDIVKTTVFMTDLGQFSKMNEIYASFFKKDPPARAAFEVKSLPKNSLIEIEAIAAK